MSVEGDWRWVTPDYFKALGATLVRGRYFTEADMATAERVAVVDESFAHRFYPGEDPIGKRIKRGGLGAPENEAPWFKIVGVIRAIKHRRLDSDRFVQAYFPYYQNPVPAAMSLIVRSAPGIDPATLSAPVRRAVQEVDKNQPVFNVRTMREIFDESVAQQRLLMTLLAVFAALALLLAGVGLYGVMAYLVTQRKHEIGIRLALGARAADIFRLVIGQGLILTAIGILVGLAGAFALTRLMTSLLYGVSATDPMTFVGITLLLVSVALLACYIPARRATKVDPMIALRYE
jgi:putative ABC transport system permease protein